MKPVKSIRIPSAMIDCFYTCAKEKNFYIFYDSYRAIISDLSYFLETASITFTSETFSPRVTMNNSPHLFIVQNLQELFRLLGNFKVDQPNLRPVGSYSLEKGPGVEIWGDIKNAVITGNWINFFEKYQNIVDSIIDAARNQNIVNICIGLGNGCHPNFSTRATALRRYEPQLKWVEPSVTNSFIRGKPGDSKNSSEMLKTVAQRSYYSSSCSCCSHGQTSIRSFTPTVSHYNSNYTSTSSTQKNNAYVDSSSATQNTGVRREENSYNSPPVIYPKKQKTPEYLRQESTRAHTSSYSPSPVTSGSIKTYEKADDENAHIRSLQPTKSPPGSYETKSLLQKSVQYLHHEPNRTLPTHQRNDSSSHTLDTRERQIFESSHVFSGQRSSSYISNGNVIKPVYNKTTFDGHQDASYSSNSVTSPPQNSDRSNVPTMVSGGQSGSENHHDESTVMRTQGDHSYDSIFSGKQSGQNGHDTSQQEFSIIPGSAAERYYGEKNVQENGKRTSRIETENLSNIGKNGYDFGSPASPIQRGMNHSNCSTLIPDDCSMSFPAHTSPENEEPHKNSLYDNSQSNFDSSHHTLDFDGPSQVDNRHFGSTKLILNKNIHGSTNTKSYHDIPYPENNSLSSTVHEEHRNESSTHFHDEITSPIEIEMPPNIQQNEWDSLKPRYLSKGEIDHSNCSTLAPDDRSTPFAAQSSTESNDAEYSLRQETEDTLKRSDSFEKLEMSDGTLENLAEESQFENWESRQKKIDDEIALVESIFNLDDLKRTAVEKQESVDGTDDHEFSDFKADMSFVNHQTTEFMDNEQQKIQELRDHEYDTLRPHSPAPEEVENDSFNEKFQKIQEKQREELRQKREERKRKQKELEEELRQLRDESRERFKTFMRCIILKQRFDEQENQWKEWIRDCSKNISTLRKYYSVFEEDFQILSRKSKTLDSEDLLDFENERSRFSRYVMKAFSALHDDFNTLKEIEQYYADALFLRVLQKCLADVGRLLLEIYETTESLEPSTFGTLEEKMMKLRVDLIYSTEKLRDICKKPNEEYSNVEYPEPPSRYNIQEVD